MFNGALIGRRLSWYAGAWVGSFLLMLILCLAGPMAVSWKLTEVVDLVLPPVFLFLALGLAGTVLAALISKETLGTKLALTLLALALALPFFWAPVSGAVAAAFLAGVSIEYSSVYAAFRIAISRVLYPVYAILFGAGLVQQVWNWFQALSTVVGVFSGLIRLWPVIVQILGGRPKPAEALDL